MRVVVVVLLALAACVSEPKPAGSEAPEYWSCQCGHSYQEPVPGSASTRTVFGYNPPQLACWRGDPAPALAIRENDLEVQNYQLRLDSQSPKAAPPPLPVNWKCMCVEPVGKDCSCEQRQLAFGESAPLAPRLEKDNAFCQAK